MEGQLSTLQALSCRVMVDIAMEPRLSVIPPLRSGTVALKALVRRDGFKMVAHLSYYLDNNGRLMQLSSFFKL
jgi:hypothetical protein